MSALLTAAADVIERNGFVGGKYYQVKLDTDGWRPNKECPVCPRGAIAIAAGQVPDFMVLPDDSGRTAVESDPVACQQIRDAEVLLALYLLDEQGAATALTDGEVIEDWADDPVRTQPQVVGAMRAAAEYRPAAR